jgi:predicted CoA-binding protein
MSQSVDVQTQLKEAFLRQPRFAVVGASKDQSKWGTKVRVWWVFDISTLTWPCI